MQVTVNLFFNVFWYVNIIVSKGTANTIGDGSKRYITWSAKAVNVNISEPQYYHSIKYVIFKCWDHLKINNLISCVNRKFDFLINMGVC